MIYRVFWGIRGCRLAQLAGLGQVAADPIG